MVEDYITLGQYLKLVEIIASGGEVKNFLAHNTVLVNGQKESRRGRKLRTGDTVTVGTKTYAVK